MRAHIIRVHRTRDDDAARRPFLYAVVAANAEAALTIVRNELGHGPDAAPTGQCLSEQDASALALVAGRPRLLS